MAFAEQLANSEVADEVIHSKRALSGRDTDLPVWETYRAEISVRLSRSACRLTGDA